MFRLTWSALAWCRQRFLSRLSYSQFLNLEIPAGQTLIRKMGASKTPSWGYRCCYCDSRVVSGGNMTRAGSRGSVLSLSWQFPLKHKLLYLSAFVSPHRSHDRPGSACLRDLITVYSKAWPAHGPMLWRPYPFCSATSSAVATRIDVPFLDLRSESTLLFYIPLCRAGV